MNTRHAELKAIWSNDRTRPGGTQARDHIFELLGHAEEVEAKLFRLAVDYSVHAGRQTVGLVGTEVRARYLARRDALIVAVSLLRGCEDEEVYEDLQQATIARAEASV